MGFLARLLGWETETRDAMNVGGIPLGLALSQSYAEDAVSPTFAENLGVVVACINAVAGGMAAQPAYVYRATPTGRVEAPRHPVARLIRQPNPHQTWPDWLEWSMGQVLSWGNSLSLIETDGAGRPIALTPIPWAHVTPVLLKSGRLVFDVMQYATPWGGTTERRRLLAEECLFLKDRSDDGIIGRSRISRAPGIIRNAASLQDLAGSVWRNGARPTGALSFPKSLSDHAANRLRDQFNDLHTGSRNAGRPLLLEDGLTWQALSVPPGDAEILASRRFSREDLATLFGVPAPVVGILDHATYTNSETLLRFFAQQTLAAWCRKIEQEFARSVFGTGSEYSIEISLDGLLRGDPDTRWKTYAVARQHDILSVREIREIEGYSPVPPAQQAEAPDAAEPVSG
jgi:HK97 family phage portal protein